MAWHRKSIVFSSNILSAGEINGPVLTFALIGLAASLATEVLKFARGMQGGETGTGGRF